MSDKLKVAACKRHSSAAGNDGSFLHMCAFHMDFKCCTCIMVLNEGNSSGGPHAHEARGAALAIHQPPVLPSPHGLLQNTCISQIPFLIRGPCRFSPECACCKVLHDHASLLPSILRSVVWVIDDADVQKSLCWLFKF